MPELRLRQPRFTYSACGIFTKNYVKIRKFKKAGDSKYIYKNELDKDYFAHEAAYADSEDLAMRSISDKILRDRAYEIAINHEYGGYQKRLASMPYNVFDKKTEKGAFINKVLARELHKPVEKREKSMQGLSIIFGQQI